MRKAKTENTMRLQRKGVDSRNVFFDGRHLDDDDDDVRDADGIWQSDVSPKQEPERQRCEVYIVALLSAAANSACSK